MSFRLEAQTDRPALTYRESVNFHKRLTRLGLPLDEHYAYASGVLGRRVRNFTDLTRAEAGAVRQVAEAA